MMKNEFEALIGHEISAEEYHRIETIYTWHPAISNVNGKHEMAQIYALPEAIKSNVLENMLVEAREVMEHDQMHSRASRIAHEDVNFRDAVTDQLACIENCIEEIQEDWDKAFKFTKAAEVSDDEGAEDRKQLKRMLAAMGAINGFYKDFLEARERLNKSDF